MRILLHDHAGHAFTASLGRELARRGHKVRYVHCATFRSAKGCLELRTDDPESLTFAALSHWRPFAKYRWSRRVLQEIEYGIKGGRLIRRWKPDVVISCNTPLLSQALMTRASRRAGVPTVAWVQDIYSYAAADVVASLAWPLRSVVSTSLARVEARTLRNSDQVVSISRSFVDQLLRWGISPDRLTTLPNWPAIEDIPVLARPCGWERRHELDAKFVFMYTGILGLKHNPNVLMELASRFAGRAEIVVIADGPGIDWLRMQSADRGLQNLHLFDFVSHGAYAEALSTADVFLVLLTEESSRYSVPSKVLSYLCAGRPVIGVMPLGNDAAEMLIRSGAGRVVPTGDDSLVARIAEQLFGDVELRKEMGLAARSFALREFGISERADAFESTLYKATTRRKG